MEVAEAVPLVLGLVLVLGLPIIWMAERKLSQSDTTACGEPSMKGWVARDEKTYRLIQLAEESFGPLSALDTSCLSVLSTSTPWLRTSMIISGDLLFQRDSPINSGLATCGRFQIELRSDSGYYIAVLRDARSGTGVLIASSLASNGDCDDG